MSISKEEREAYENGRKEAEYNSKHPISYLFTPNAMLGLSDRPDDPHLAAAYDKGLKKEQLDD